MESQAAGEAGPIFASPRARRAADENEVDLALLAGRGSGPNGRIVEQDVLTFQEETAAQAVLAATEISRTPKSSPLARAVASDTGLDLANLAGTGAGGRITAGDVRDAAGTGEKETPPAPPVPAPTGARTITLTGLRKRVADNVARSARTAPHVTLNLRADMTAAQKLRADLLPAIEAATSGVVRLSPTDIIVKAVAHALREHPHVNAHLEGDTITLFDDVHVGLAVSLGEDGLIVPVIRNANRKGLADIARARHDLAARARSGKLGPDDLSGGTFTVTNLGAYGIESFNPIIAPPQIAILGVGAIQDEIVAVEGAPVVRPRMGLSLSFDHRAMDGAPAAAFLARVRVLLENPFLLLV
jgi:pyruvate dehydrogenase E2 component (dihydrolipoamide acetyltransferase)